MYGNILNKFSWSYSKLNSYCTCPKQFFLTYIVKSESKPNAYAQFGNLVHSLLASYFNVELRFDELYDMYVKEYDRWVTADFNNNPDSDLNESYYDSGLKYFSEFEGLFDNCEVLDVEKRFTTKIGDHKFVGIIDLILKDKNGIAIVDHKSKGKFASKADADEYFKQLYIYGQYVYEKYGEYPYKLTFNLFRSQELVEKLWDNITFSNVKMWALDTIKQIYEDESFDGRDNYFFCNNLCTVSETCK